MPIPPVVLPSAPVLCWIVPPEQSAVLGAVRVAAVPTAFGATAPPHRPPVLPVTVRPPEDPVVSSTIPTPAVPEAVPALIDRKVRPLAPLVAPVTLTVPPLMAVKAALAPVERTSPPLKVMVPLSLLSRLTPVPPVAVTEPVNWTRPGVPVLRFVTSTVRPAALLIVPP